MPQDLMFAVEHAYRILAWYDGGLMKDEVPPEWAWPFEEVLDDWFDEVDRKRNSDDDDSDMVQNEFARGMRR